MSDLRSVGPVAMAVTGVVAVTPRGEMFGAEHDYFRVEMVVLEASGALANDALTVSVVHDCQVIERSSATSVDSYMLDLVVTPTTVYRRSATARAGRFASVTLDRSSIDAIPGPRAILTGWSRSRDAVAATDSRLAAGHERRPGAAAADDTVSSG